MQLSPKLKDKISQLFRGFSNMTGMTATLTDIQGVVLASSEAKPACEDFSHENSKIQCVCEKSKMPGYRRQYEGEEAYGIYVCSLGSLHGAMDVCIKGEKIGCVFVGPLLLEKSDLDALRKQAFAYGYSEKAYTQMAHLRMVHRLVVFAISIEETKYNQEQEEKQLMQSNAELEKAFEQLQQTEEELRCQYDELLKKEEMVRETEERYLYAVEGSRDGVWDWHVPSGKNFISHRWGEMLGYEPSEVEGNVDFFRSLVHPEDKTYVESVLDRFFNGSCLQQDYEFRMRGKDGSYRWIKTRGKVFEWDEKGVPRRIVGTQRDVTENRMLEQKLKESQRRITLALEASEDGWWDTNYVTGEGVISDKTKEIWGIDSNVVSADTWKQMIHPEDRNRILQAEKKKMQQKKGFSHYYRILRPDGEIRWVLDRGRAVEVDEDGNIQRVSGMITDRSQEVEEERDYERRKKVLEALFNHSPDALVYTELRGKENIIRMTNRRFEEMFEYSVEEASGADLDKLILPADKTNLGRNITQTAYKIHYYEGRGIRYKKSGAAIPVILRLGPAVLNGKVFGVQGSYTDISKLVLTENKLRKTLQDAVVSLSRISEKRDLYTSDHQKRVASLAVAIAKEMEWHENKIQGLRTAALLHDIGKIMIPSEILSKPSRLSQLEFEYIKTHSQNAYDILKNIEFEWPVADMVLQHHERCDGSGYPGGLTKQAILPEARILIVADVVEAISSHRPYRPALGIEVALDEINNRRGSWYDHEVVDICLKLFQSGSFSFG